MRILVGLAIEPEFAPWRRDPDIRIADNGRTRAALRDVRLRASATIRGATVDFLVTGMGAANARRAIREALLRHDYQMCIAAGLSGALDATLDSGDIVVPESVRRTDDPSTAVSCDTHLIQQAQSSGARKVKTLLTVSHIVHNASEKTDLARSADIVDMESYEIVSAANDQNIPVVAIRAISDTAAENLPAGMETLVDEFGRAKPGEAIWSVAKRPWTLPSLIRLGQASKSAAANLARFLKSYLEIISVQDQMSAKRDLQGIAAPLPIR